MHRFATLRGVRFDTLRSAAWPVCLALLLGMAACSDSGPSDGSGDASTTDSSATTDSGTTTDSTADAPSPQGGGDGGASPDVLQPGDARTCSVKPVWPQNGAGFTLEISGGFVAPPPADSGCNGVNTTYEFSLSAKTLRRLACNFAGRSEVIVHLGEGASMQIVSALEGLRTSCPGSTCGADYPDVVLTVRAPGAAIAYSSDFYAGCPNNGVAPPFIAYQTLGEFERLLNGIVTAACDPDGGSDAVTCSQG